MAPEWSKYKTPGILRFLIRAICISYSSLPETVERTAAYYLPEYELMRQHYTTLWSIQLVSIYDFDMVWARSSAFILCSLST